MSNKICLVMFIMSFSLHSHSWACKGNSNLRVSINIKILSHSGAAEKVFYQHFLLPFFSVIHCLASGPGRGMLCVVMVLAAASVIARGHQYRPDTGHPHKWHHTGKHRLEAQQDPGQQQGASIGFSLALSIAPWSGGDIGVPAAHSPGHSLMTKVYTSTQLGQNKPTVCKAAPYRALLSQSCQVGVTKTS